MGHELIEYIVAGACAARVAAQLLDITVLGEFFREYEGAAGDPALDFPELNTRTAQVCLGWHLLDRRSIAHALEDEGQLDPVGALGGDPAGYGFSTHL